LRWGYILIRINIGREKMKKTTLCLAAIALCFCSLYPQEKSAETIPLTLKDCILKAMEENLDIAVQAYDPAISEISVTQAKEIYWPQIGIGYTNYNYNRLSNWAVEGSNYTTQNLNYSFSLHQQVFTGGNININLFSASSDTTRALTLVNPSYTGQLELSLNQPILRGFGSMSKTNIDIKKAQNLSDISVTGLKSSLIQKVYDVESAYWNLVYAIESLKVNEAILDQTKERLNITKEAERIGVKSSLDVLGIETEAANFENRVISSRALVATYEDRLKGILSFPAEGLVSSKSLIPTDEPILEKLDLSFEDALEIAIAESPSMEKYLKEIENTRLDVKYYKNQLLPQLDLEASLWFDGQSGDQLIYKNNDPYSGEIIDKIEGSRFDSIQDVFGFKYRNWYLRLNLTLPLDTLFSKAGLAKARLEEEKKLKEIEKTRQEIYYAVLEAYKELQNREKEVESATRYRQLAEKRLEAEEQRYNLGLAGNEWLFQYQRDVANARVSEIKAIIDYKISVAKLEWSLGVSLKNKNIAFRQFEF
jgi:outer membrane protein TolC